MAVLTLGSANDKSTTGIDALGIEDDCPASAAEDNGWFAADIFVFDGEMKPNSSNVRESCSLLVGLWSLLYLYEAHVGFKLTLRAYWSSIVPKNAFNASSCICEYLYFA